MKEFCLIPRATAEKYLFNKVMPGNELKAETQKEGEGVKKGGGLKLERLKKSKGLKPERPGIKTSKVLKPEGQGIKKSKVLKPERRGRKKSTGLKKLSVRLKPERVKGIHKSQPINIGVERINPSLNHLIPIHFKTARHREYASALLHYLQNNKLIVWDEDGQLLSPISNMNLMDIISQLVQGQRFISIDKLPSIKILLDYVHLPKNFIENKKARRQLYGLDWEPY